MSETAEGLNKKNDELGHTKNKRRIARRKLFRKINNKFNIRTIGYGNQRGHNKNNKNIQWVLEEIITIKTKEDLIEFLKENGVE